MKANEEEFTTKTTAFGLRLFAIRNRNTVVVKLRPVELREFETISEDDFTMEIYMNNPPLVGMAKCHTNDKFDFRRGVGLATLRLLEQHWRNQKQRCEKKLLAVTREKERRLREIGITPGFVKVVSAEMDNNHPTIDARLSNQETSSC